MGNGKVGKILVIAGSDSSGGAGLEADQKVIAAHGCYAMTATTALTAQTTVGVEEIHNVPSTFVARQIRCTLDDITADVVKTGMLASAETIQAVAETLKEFSVPILIVDPVFVATSGARLLPEEAIDTLIESLLPMATVITPNVPEAILLLRKAGRPTKDISSLDDLIHLSKELLSLGPRYVLLKGGHMPLSEKNEVVKPEDQAAAAVVNILAGNDSNHVLRGRFVKSKNTHGTGCSLASAIASNMAIGKSVVRSVEAATLYVEAGIRLSVDDFGKGNGPINHFHSTYTLPFVPGHFLDYLLQRNDVKDVWKCYTEHEFVAKLGKGSLEKEKFRHYLIQDYLFLVQYARAYALAAYKSTDIDDIADFGAIAHSTRDEMALHLSYCAEFGMSKADVEAHSEDLACAAYTRYVLDIGQSKGWLALQFALGPCLIGYGSIATRLLCDAGTKVQGNTYSRWIENYSGDNFSAAVKAGSDLIERHVINESPYHIEELVRIFVRATKLETSFWDMALSA